MGIKLLLPSFDVTEQHVACVYGKSDRTPEEARSYYSQRLWDDVQAAYQAGGIDLFFSYYYSASLDPGVIDRIRGLGVPTVNFYCNSIHQFHLVAEIAPHFDYCMFPERDTEPLYRAVGANPIHIQMAANHTVYKPYDLPRIYDVTFVGQRYHSREEYIAYLYANGIDCHAWGPGWDYGLRRKNKSFVQTLRYVKRHFYSLASGTPRPDTAVPHLPPTHRHPPLPDDELIRMYSRSHISLGFSEVPMPDGSVRRHIRLRDFEAPMSGALYFTGYQDELADYYEIGKEIICYDDKHDLLDKVQYYLIHNREAEKIRKAGRERALSEHTWEKRFCQLFSIIALSNMV
jgi:spore maturation protein CgeB